ncbi:hypothetical protein [Shewanella piezotolerans]|nr:hypothetical protein [Shewanella piezotolerans]
MSIRGTEQQQSPWASIGDGCFMVSGVLMIVLVLVNDWLMVINFLLYRNG